MELHLIPVEAAEGERLILYRPLIQLAFIGNRAMAALAQRYAESSAVSMEPQEQEAIQFLDRVGFFTPDPQPMPIEATLTSAVLLLTNRCQLRCAYCYAAGGEGTPRFLQIETGKKAIDLVHEQAEAHGMSEFRVDFHGGGEPTLEWETLQTLVQYARQKSLPARISVTSNLIWSEAQADWLMGHLDFISVSMDGSPATQDRQRPRRNQKPSSAIVMQNIRRLDEDAFHYGIRMTACAPWTHLKEDVRYIIENTRCRAMQVEPAFNIQRGSHNQPADDEANAFIGAFLEAYELVRSNQANLTYSGARPTTTASTFCTAPFNALVINPENQVVACYEITDAQHPFAGITTFGEVTEGELRLDQAARERFWTLLSERFASCRDCFCHWTCAGDCFARAFAPGPGGHLSKNLRCFINREITRFLLLDLIRSSGGVWRGSLSKNNFSLYG